MYSYQFCSMYQINQGEFNYFDGIAQTDIKILSSSDYTKLKEIIIPNLQDEIKKENLIITSLSFLGES